MKNIITLTAAFVSLTCAGLLQGMEKRPTGTIQKEKTSVATIYSAFKFNSGETICVKTKNPTSFHCSKQMPHPISIPTKTYFSPRTYFYEPIPDPKWLYYTLKKEYKTSLMEKAAD